MSKAALKQKGQRFSIKTFAKLLKTNGYNVTDARTQRVYEKVGIDLVFWNYVIDGEEVFLSFENHTWATGNIYYFSEINFEAFGNFDTEEHYLKILRLVKGMEERYIRFSSFNLDNQIKETEKSLGIVWEPQEDNRVIKKINRYNNDII